MKKAITFLAIVVLFTVLVSSCSVANILPKQAVQQLTNQLYTIQTAISPTRPSDTFTSSPNTLSLSPSAPSATPEITSGTAPTSQPAQVSTTSIIPAPANIGSTSDYESVLENIYNQVAPSVVNIQVIQQSSSGSFFGVPNQPGSSEALGSGFIWDNQGHIVTNNHVVDGATKITVTFSNGDTYPAQTVGTDPYSDLAVIKVNASASLLKPVTLADSNSVQVGQIAIAIGTPFGLQGSMTIGIVSALGRSLPVDPNSQNGSSYQIPDVIQTDAAINPGNSGGVLVDDQGHVIGVTFAIQSSTNSNSGIGFVIPSAIVSKVAPSLIKTGTYAHSWLGITGIALTPDLAKAMNLPSDQRGALVGDVASGGPADKAGLLGSTQTVTVNGQDFIVGGDVITTIDQHPVKSMDDVIAYLAINSDPGQTINLAILRNGKQQNIGLTLGIRPTIQQQINQSPHANAGGAYLGVDPITMTPDIAQAMNLDSGTTGVLLMGIQAGSPAARAGLRGGNTPFDLGGQQIMIGGDIILAIDGQSIATIEDLGAFLASAQPGENVRLTILRRGTTRRVSVTLAAQTTQ